MSRFENVSTESFESAILELRKFVERRNWNSYHDPKSLALALAGEAWRGLPSTALDGSEPYPRIQFNHNLALNWQM